MFGEFLNIIVRSIKLDKTLYKDNKNFGEAAIYFAGLIMILDGLQELLLQILLSKLLLQCLV